MATSTTEKPATSDCPGRFKCHGPISWCDYCGEVDLVCDDPNCEVHQRGYERRREEKKTRLALAIALDEYNSRSRAWEEALKLLQRYETGNAIMVSRTP